MVNRVILVGRVATDPMLRYTPDGTPVATFRIAVSRRSRGPSGEKTADFFDVVVWRQGAEFCGQYVTKGRLIAVDGRLQERTFFTQDGQRRRVVEVVAWDIRLLDRPPEVERVKVEEEAAEVPLPEEILPEEAEIEEEFPPTDIPEVRGEKIEEVPPKPKFEEFTDKEEEGL